MKPTKTKFLLHAIAGMIISTSLLNSAFSSGIYHNARESVEVSDHHVFNTADKVNGATTLIRNFRHKDVVAHISSKALEPDTAYSIWWAVFNRPRFCAQAFECAVSDLETFGGDPRVKASVFWGGGFVSDESGTANTSIQLMKGRTGRELFANTKNYGLQNLAWAEIHLVLRTHGPAGLAGPVASQIGTANEACPVDGCKNVFASIHIAGQ